MGDRESPQGSEPTGHKGKQEASKTTTLFKNRFTSQIVTHFKRLSREHFGGKKNPQSGEKHEKIKKSMLQNGSVDLGKIKKNRKIWRRVIFFMKKRTPKELTIEGSSQVNCALENEIREMSEMHSIADFMKENGLGNDDFKELLSGLNNDNLVSSESEAEDLISSSEDEKEVSVLDSHEDIMNDLFKEDDGLNGCVGGDFNVVRFPSEKSNGGRTTKSMRAFNNFLQDTNMGIPIYSMRNLLGRILGRMRFAAGLDRFIFTSEWEELFPNVRQKTLVRVTSDHCSVKIDTSKLKWGPCSFSV
ncbi:hypothetical protein M0R45_026631 [Rubus argutus]|uniref:Uncharacterized protein n=1 Tax=Rubus argutus TaxID=59490 RepID=A0AAW1X1Q6_RUBAR